MPWPQSLALLLLFLASRTEAVCSCTYDNGRNGLPPYLDTSGDGDPSKEAVSGTQQRSYTAQLIPNAGCPATVKKPYTLRVFPHLSNQITHMGSWKFTYDPTEPLGWPKSDNFDQYHEIVVFTHEDANGKVYASEQLLFYILSHNFDGLSDADKLSEKTRLINNFCRSLMVPPPTSLPWTQLQVFKFLYPDNAHGDFLVTSLLDNKRERGCVAALSMCSDTMLSYTAQWKDGQTQPLLGSSLPTSSASDSPPFSFLLESQGDLKLKASATVPLPTTFQVPNTRGEYDLAFNVCGSNPADSTAKACSSLPLKYIDCRVGFSFAATPIKKTNSGQVPGTSGSTNFFNLYFDASNRSTIRPFDVFSNVTAHSDCGTYSVTMTSTGTGLSLSQTSTSQWRLQYDPSTYTPLTTYGKTMTITLTLSYNSRPFSIQYQFELRVWNCIPQKTPPTMIVLAHSSTSQSQTYTDFAGIGLNQGCLATSPEAFDLSANSNLASLASSTGNQLTIASNPAVLAAVAGTYTILHTHGTAKETFQMIVCAIVEPAVYRQSGKDLHQVDSQSSALYVLDYHTYSKSNALCPGIWYNWFVSSDSDYDPFSSPLTAFKTPTSDNYSQYFGWSLWMNAAKPSPVVVKISFQVLFHGTTDPGISHLHTIEVYDCARTRITPPAPIDPALVEVELGTNFSITTGWGKFAFTGAETICQVTRHKVVATFADGSNIVWHVVNAQNWPIASQKIVTFNTNNRWRSTMLTTNLGMWLAESRFADLADKTVLCGLNRLVISGGYIDAANMLHFDETNSLTFTVKIIDPCTSSKVLTIHDATKLLYISGQPSHFVSTQLLVDESLFEQNPLELAVDKTKFTANEALCGLITLGWTAKHADSTDVFHAGVSQLAQASTPIISISYSSWPAGVLERHYTLTLLAWHQKLPAYVASHSIEVTDVRCSIRFSGLLGNVVPPSTYASTPATLGPVALNTLASSETFTFPLNANTPLKCLDLAYASIWLSGPATSNVMTEMPPTWTQRLAFNKFKITPLTPLYNQAGVYTGQVRRSQLYTVTKDLDFEMVLCWITQPIVKFDYTDPTDMQEPFSIDVVGSKSVLNVVLTAYSVNDVGKCGPLVYSASTSSQADPDFDAFSLGLATITHNKLVFNSINVSGKYPLGTLTVTVKVRLSSASANAYQTVFTIDVVSRLANPPNSAPQVNNRVSMVNATAEESLIYTVGIPYDMQLDNFYLSKWGVKGGETPAWVQFVNNTISAGIKFKISPSLANEGEQYEVFYTLQDTNSRQPMSQKYNFTLSVVVLSSNLSEREQGVVAKQEKMPEIIKVFVGAPDNERLIEIRFSKEIKLPSNATDWSDLNEGSKRLNVSLIVSQSTETLFYDQDLRLEMSWTVAEVHTKDKDGNVRVVTPKKPNALNKTRQLDEASNANETLIEVEKLKLKLNFTQPTILSRTAFDKVRVEVLQHMFKEETLTYPSEIALFVDMNKQDYTWRLNIPRQYDQGMIDAAAELTERAGNALKAFLGANVLISLFSAGALQYLWGLINSLQMIVLTVLFKVDISPNADMIMTMILKLCQLEIIDSTLIIGLMFDFRETAAFETTHYEDGETYSKFGDVGYDSAIYIELLGLIFVIVLAYCALAILRKLLQLACTRCGDNCLSRRVRRRQQYEVVIIRFLLESCLEIGMSAMLSLLLEILSFSLAILSLLGLVLAPVFFIRMAIRFRSQMAKAEDEREITAERAALFKGYRVNMFALLYPVVFFLRRYFMFLVCTLMPGLKYAQIFSQIFVTMTAIYYIISFKPMSDPLLNKQETFNELSVLIAAYPLFFFTNWVDDIETRVNAGWFVVACICFNVLINMAILDVQILLQAYRSLKYCCIRRQRIKERRERLRRLQQQILLSQQQVPEQSKHVLEGEPDNVPNQVIQANERLRQIENDSTLPENTDLRAQNKQESIARESQNQEDQLVSIEDENYMRRLGYDRNGFALADQDFVVDDPNHYLPPRQQQIEEMKRVQLQRQGLTSQLLGPQKLPQKATASQLARIDYDSILPPWVQLSQFQLEDEQKKRAELPAQNKQKQAKKGVSKSERIKQQ